MDSTRKAELRRKYELATHPISEELKKEFLEFTVRASVGTISSEKLQGMLMLLNLPSTWISDFQKALKENKEEK